MIRYFILATIISSPAFADEWVDNYNRQVEQQQQVQIQIQAAQEESRLQQTAQAPVYNPQPQGGGEMPRENTSPLYNGHGI